MNPVIATQGLTKRFGGKTVVDRLDLAVPAGSVFALLGDNGAGKSTTIRMLTGLLPPDAGRADDPRPGLLGRRPRPPPPRRLRPGEAALLRLDDRPRDRLVHRRLPRAPATCRATST